MSTFPWTKEKDALLIRLHREGKSWAYISRQIGCAGHDTVIVRYHAITGEEYKPKKINTSPWTPGMDALLLRLKDAGMVFRDIAKRLGKDRVACQRRYLVLTGADSQDESTRRKQRPPVEWTKELDNRLLRLRAYGFPWKAIEERLGRGHSWCRERYVKLIAEKAQRREMARKRREKKKRADQKRKSAPEKSVQPKVVEPPKPVQKTAEVPVKPEPAPSKPWTKVADMFLMALRLNREPWQVVAQSLARDVAECKARLAY